MIKYLFAPVRLVGGLIKLFIVHAPGSLGIRLRYIYYSFHLKSIGKNVIIDVGVHIDRPDLITLGHNVHIDKYCIISTGKKLIGDISTRNNFDYTGLPGEITLGDDVHIAQFCIIMGHGGISIGDKCVASAGCKIYSLTNTSRDMSEPERVISIQPYDQAPFLCGPVVLHENVWLGLHTIIMPSVSIKKNSFCVSNSVVNKSFPENSHIAGTPAIKIKNRFQ